MGPIFMYIEAQLSERNYKVVLSLTFTKVIKRGIKHFYVK